MRASLGEIENALIEYPEAVVVTDSWTDCWDAELSVVERDAIKGLGRRTAVVVTTARLWAHRASELEFGPQIKVIAKPYDLEELIEAVRASTESAFAAEM